MIQWTDRHWRYMFRYISRETLVYSEMVVDGTVIYNAHDLEPFIGHDDVEHPLALQLGGCDAGRVGEAAYLCERYAQWHSINLNCGCPSNKAKRAGFGAELMLDPVNTGIIVKEMMRRVTHTDVTVKCRLGVLPGHDSFEELQKFVREVTNAGCRTMIIHARNVVLTGLSPAQNRSIPPLRYDDVHRLVKQWPDVSFVLNGGLRTFEECEKHLGRSDMEPEEHPVVGCMVGREAYKNPWLFAEADSRFFGKTDPGLTRREALEGYLDYCQRYAQKIIDRNEEREEQLEAAPHLDPTKDEEGLDGDGDRHRKVKKRGVFSMGELIKPLHHFFSGCPTGQRVYKNRLEELLLRHAKAKEARKAGTEHLWNVGAGEGEEGTSGLRSQFVFDFTQLEREESGELLVELVEEAVKTIPEEFLDAPPGGR